MRDLTGDMATSQSDESDHSYVKTLLSKLTSTVNSEISEAKDQIHHLLLDDSSDSNTVLGDLFNLYVSTKCLVASQILVDQSQQCHVSFLLDKMNDSFKNPDTKYPTLMLLWSIIQRQPSWLHTIISTAFFNSVIKCLKECTSCKDVVILLTGILLITALLPSVPSLVGSILDDFFDIFEKAFLFTTRRGIIPDTHLLHLQVGVHAFFHRLYAMYPNSTVTFMKSCYDAHHGKEVDKAIESLFRWVKLHPWLITETEQTEISNTRWKSKETHDVVIDCEKLSLDPYDCHLQEGEVLSPSRQSFCDGAALESSGILTSSDNSIQHAVHEDDRLDMATQTGASLQDRLTQHIDGSFDSGTGYFVAPVVTANAMVCSPTTLCSLTTPPESKDTSPSSSILDVSIGHNQSLAGHIRSLELSGFTKSLERTTESRKPRSNTASSTTSGMTGDVSNSGRASPFVEGRCNNTTVSSGLNNSGRTTPSVDAAIRPRLTRLSSSDRSTWEICTGSIVIYGNHTGKTTPSVETHVASSGRTTPYKETNLNTSSTNTNQAYVTNSGRITPSSEKRNDTLFCTTDDKKQKGTPISDSTLINNRDNSLKTPEVVDDSKCGKQKFPCETLEMMFSLTKTCRNCLENRGENTHRVRGDWDNQQSPGQLLDQYLKFGKDRKIDRIPLSSHAGTEWTHFGGRPPPDEITLLQNELLFLQSEVLFERHKCDLHATRNRRLVGKVFQTNAIKEELLAIRDKAKFLEIEMVTLEVHLNEQVAENRLLKERAGSRNSQQQQIISDLSTTNERLVVEKEEVVEDLKQFRSENERLQAELKEEKARISQLENEMFHLKSLESENELLRSQSNMQAKTLVIMGEREQQLKDIILFLRTTIKKSPEDEAKQKIYQKELETLHEIVNDQKSELNLSKSHISELETSITQKEHQTRDLKKTLDNAKKVWIDKLDAIESKYQTIKRANQRLESEVMGLQSKLNARTRDNR